MEYNIEKLAAAVHKAYCDNYIIRKRHPYWTNGDYSLLDDETKEIDRQTVRTVLTEFAKTNLSTVAKPCSTRRKESNLMNESRTEKLVKVCTSLELIREEDEIARSNLLEDSEDWQKLGKNIDALDEVMGAIQELIHT